MSNRIEVEISAVPQRIEVALGGSTGDMEAIQRLLQAAAGALARMGRWDEARAVARTLPAGSEAEATLDLAGDAPLFAFGVPVGPEGRQGPPGEAGGINIYRIEVPVSADGWVQNADELYTKAVSVEGVRDGDTVRADVTPESGVLLMAVSMPDLTHLELVVLDKPTGAFTVVLTVQRNGGGVTSMTVEAAERLVTPRLIEMRGDVAGAAEFDGSADAVVYTVIEAMTADEIRGIMDDGEVVQ